MKRLLYILFCCLVLSGCASQQEATEKLGKDIDLGVSHVRQLVAEDNSTARTIMWRSEAAKDYALEYRIKQTEQAARAKSKIVKATDASFRDGSASYTLYSVRLTELAKRAEYEYRVTSGADVGQWHQLRLDKGDSFTAIIFPDSQSADYSGWQRLAQSAAERHREAQLYLSMGDLVDNGADRSQWWAWFNGVEPFSDRMAFAPVIGNHEAYSLEYKFRLPEAYTQLFALPKNGLEQYPNQFYSFDYGDVHFTVIDTNFYELDALQPNLRSDELRWLEQDLAKSKAKWKIVLQHRDIMMYGFGPESGRAQTAPYFDDEGRDLMPIYERYNVDAVLSAHLHTYRRRTPLRNFAPAQDGITYIITGVAGDVRYPKLWGENKLDVATAPQPETANYMTLEAEQGSLTFKAFLEDGSMFDQVRLTK